MNKTDITELVKEILETEQRRAGLRTDAQLAAHLGTNVTMLWRWRNGFLPTSIRVLLPALYRQMQAEQLETAA